MDPIHSYTDIYQLLLTSLFYMGVFPANTILHCASLICVYWLQKYYLLRRYSRPKLLQSQICFETLFFIKVAAFTQSVIFWSDLSWVSSTLT